MTLKFGGVFLQKGYEIIKDNKKKICLITHKIPDV